jgi:hypothetical protein
VATGNAAYLVAIIAALPLGFHFFGIFGAVVAVAAGDFPLYVVFVIAASREGVSTWRQDLQTTGIFLTLLALGLGARMSILK